MKKILLVMFIVLFTAASGFCSEFEDTLKAAEQGNAVAQYNLGWMYSEGEGVAQDNERAVYWYTKSAEQGDAWAQFNLGNIYYKGQGVPQDYKQAAYWFKKAAEQGQAKAQNCLGWMYEDGQGVPQDYKQAAYWHTKSAEQGNAWAQFDLGNIYYKGQGAPQDYKRAVYWYTKSAEQGDVGAQQNLAFMYFNGQGVTQNFKLAYVWESLAASQGHEKATINRDITAKELTPQQLSEAQDLAAQIQYKIDNPTKTPKRRAPASSSTTDVRWVQQTLKKLGYDPGPVDGFMGARTRDAIIKFQTDIGVAPTGIIDEGLLSQLRL